MLARYFTGLRQPLDKVNSTTNEKNPDFRPQCLFVLSPNKIKSDNPGQCKSVKKPPLGLVNARLSHSLIIYQILVLLAF